LLRVLLREKVINKQEWKQKTLPQIYSDFKEEFYESLSPKMKDVFHAYFPEYSTLGLFMRRCMVRQSFGHPMI